MDPSKLLDDGETVRMSQLDDNLEMQIALDELSAGSETALHLYLAKQAGVDPSTVRLRSMPWHFEQENGSTLDYVGKLDPTDHQAQVNIHEKQPIRQTSINFMGGKGLEAYEYERFSEPTKQIRLLRLGRASQDFPDVDYFDHLKVETFDLESAPIYFCLSYVWGAPERFVRVDCDGKVLFATQNLFHALRNIFVGYPNCYLWADGICINQEDVEERAFQVKLMGQIYSQCQLVIAHPGHFRYGPVEAAQKAMDKNGLATTPTAKDTSSSGGDVQSTKEATKPLSILQEAATAVGDGRVPSVRQGFRDTSQSRAAVSLMNYITRIWEKQKDYEILLDTEWKQYNLPGTNGGDWAIWENLLEFWTEDWLWRAWVLPECILPAKVTVMFNDKHMVSLDAIMDFWDNAYKRGLPSVLRHGPLASFFLRTMHLTPVTVFLAVRRQRKEIDEANPTDGKIRAESDIDSEASALLSPDNEQKVIRSIWKQTPDLLHVLVLCRNDRATDDRDKVYAFLGLADDSVSRSITPDYHESNTVQQTFTDVAQKYIEAGRGTELLEHAGVHHKITGLPSWVPDWTHQSRSRFEAKLYSTSGNLEDSVTISELGSGKVHFKGVSLAKVKAVGVAWRFYLTDTSAPTFMPMISNSGTSIDIPPFGDEDARCFLLQFATMMVQDAGPRTRDLYPNIDEALMRTLCADRSWSGSRLSSSETELDKFMTSRRAFAKFYARAPDPDPDAPHLSQGHPIRVHKSGIFHWQLDFDEEEGDRLMKELWPFAMAIQETMRGRRFVSLDSAYFAIVPWDTQAGDEIVMVKGSRLPFVVRPVDSEAEGTFGLVGDCYVHGIMDGELMKNAGDDVGKQSQDVESTDTPGRDLKVLLPNAPIVSEWEEYVII